MADPLDVPCKTLSSYELNTRPVESMSFLNGASNCPTTQQQYSKDAECTQCLYRSHCLIRELMAPDVEGFEFAIKHRRPLHKGEHLYRQASTFESLYIVHTGIVKIYHLDEEGEERVWGFHLPGEVVGTDGLYGQKYNNSAVALDTATVCELSMSNLMHLFRTNSSFIPALLSRIYGEVVESQFMTIQSHKSSEQQLAAFLIRMSRRYEKRHLSSSKFRLVMPRRDIASYLGMAVETVSRILTRFHERGWLRVKCRELTIINKEALELLALK